eukprot:Tamp_27562.p3 GENE.Tamp_27562~~Tamp_27562.p3  ORF type:complete len:142 (+),score=11.53 Tamp_27562:217-642(+)
MQQARSLGRARRGWHTGTAALLLMLSCICALRSASSTRLARLLDLRGAQGPVAGGGGGSGRCMAFGGAGRLTPLRGGDDTSGRGGTPVPTDMGDPSMGLAPFWESPHVATDCGVFLWEEENDMQRVNVNPHRDSTRPDPLP